MKMKDFDHTDRSARYKTKKEEEENEPKFTDGKKKKNHAWKKDNARAHG